MACLVDISQVSFKSCLKAIRNFPTISEDYRRFPKIAEDFRERSGGVSVIHQRVEYS